MRDCPVMGGISGSFSASVAMRPMGWGTHTSAGRGRGRGRVPGSSGPLNRTYALASHQDQEASLNAITGILLVCSRGVYALIDLGSRLSYISPWVANKIDIESELIKPF